MDSVKEYIATNWFWVALVIVIFFGYSYGKDMALREHAENQTVSQLDIKEYK